MAIGKTACGKRRTLGMRCNCERCKQRRAARNRAARALRAVRNGLRRRGRAGAVYLGYGDLDRARPATEPPITPATEPAD